MTTIPIQTIGQKITEIKYFYNPENEFGLQEFESFIKIEDNSIIQIPYFTTQQWNDAELRKKFDDAKSIKSKYVDSILNLKIINYHFTYFEDELDEMEKAIIELENGIYITEKNYGPIGLTNIDLQIMNKAEFLNFIENLDSEFEIKPLINN